MKKLLNISVIAALAILPMAANAATGDIVSGDPAAASSVTPAQADNAVTASASPKYALAVEAATDSSNVATASYVKGAYNAAMKAINKVSETASNALTADGTATLTHKTIDADDNTISDLGTNNFKSGVVVDSTTGIAATSSASDTKLVTEKAVAQEIEDAAIQTVTAGTANGTISVDGGADVVIYNDSALAGRVTANENKIGNTTLTTTAQTLTGAIEEVKGTAGFAGTASELTDLNFQSTDKTSAAKAANAAMAAAAAAQTDVDAVETDLSANYAKKTGVTATISASTIAGTVPTVTVWGAETPGTAEITANITGATYTE